MLDETGPKANHVAGTRRWAGALVLGGALAVLAAALLGLSLRASSTSQAGQPRTEPRTLHPTGDFKHPSGFPMPERVGPFQRVEVTQYDEAGLNLSAGYNRLPGEGDPWPIAATVYVYPVRPGVELDAAFEKLLGDLGQMHGGAKPELRKNILLGDERLVGRYAIFGYEEPWGGLKESIPLRSYVVLYEWKGSWVKWRVTTPAPVSPERMRAIVELTETLVPPPDGAGTPSHSPSETETPNSPELFASGTAIRCLETS